VYKLLFGFAFDNPEKIKTFTLHPTIRDNFARVRVVIGHFWPVIVAFQPVLADTTF